MSGLRPTADIIVTSQGGDTIGLEGITLGGVDLIAKLERHMIGYAMGSILLLTDPESIARGFEEIDSLDLLTLTLG